MSKISLTPPPTFDLRVLVPTPTRDVPVRFTFQRRDREQLREFIEQLKGMEDDAALAAVLTGWELDDEFTPDNLKRLVDTYPAAGHAIVKAYLSASTGATI